MTNSASEQGSAAWLEWRKQGIGSSDAAAILGKSPYATPYQLWCDKLGLRENEQNEAMRFGQRFEESARARASIDLEMDFVPAVVEHEKHPFLRASLDGMCEEQKIFIEIKYVGKDKFEAALKGEIPENYLIQMDHQFMVTGFKKAYYVCYTLTSDRKKIDRFHMIEVAPRLSFIEETLYPALCDFWELVESKTPPEFSEKDVTKVTDPYLVAAASEYTATLAEMSILEEKIEKLKSVLKETLDKTNVAECGGLKISKSYRKGQIKYIEIPELELVDLELFRGKGSEVFSIRPVKDSK